MKIFAIDEEDIVSWYGCKFMYCMDVTILNQVYELYNQWMISLKGIFSDLTCLVPKKSQLVAGKSNFQIKTGKFDFGFFDGYLTRFTMLFNV